MKELYHNFLRKRHFAELNVVGKPISISHRSAMGGGKKTEEQFKDVIWRKYKWYIVGGTIIFLILFTLFLLKSKLDIQPESVKAITQTSTTIPTSNNETFEKIIETFPNTLLLLIPIALGISLITNYIFKRGRW